MSNRKTINEKIEAAKLEKEQAEARIKELLQQQKAQERKARTHRFCERGGLVEKLLPDLARLDNEQFQIFVDKVLLTPHTNRILAGLVPPTPEPAAEPEGAAETTIPAPAAQAGGTTGDAKSGGNVRSAS